MKTKMLNLSVILLFLFSGLTMTAIAAETPESIAELNKAREISGNDKYLTITERLQCRERMGNGEPQTPGSYRPATSEPTRVFDNVYYVGGPGSGGWLITTSDGYILLDSMYGNSPWETIIPNMKKFDLDPEKIKYILITHAGPDHVGGARFFQDSFGTRIIMSAKDWEAMLNPGPGSWLVRLEALRKTGGRIPPPEKDWRGPPKQDIIGTDGQKLTLGDTTITMVFTPRTRNGGGLSYIIPVKDNGKPHMWGTFGNTNTPRTLEDRSVYRESVAHFLKYMEAAKVDVMMSSHPFVDGSIDRMKELQNRKPGEPNPFVIGQDTARRFMDILDQCCVVEIARMKGGLDSYGRSLKDVPPGPGPF